jgi:nicotinamide riboside transporter PnuC
MTLLNRFKLVLAVVGFCLAVAAVLLDNRLLVWAAIASLLGSFAIRLYLRRQPVNSNSEESAHS